MKLTSSLAVAYAALAAAVSLPPPTGPYRVGAAKGLVPFYNDDDPVAPGGIQTDILATVFYPTLDREPCRPAPALDWEVASGFEQLVGFQDGALVNLTSHVHWNATAVAPGGSSNETLGLPPVHAQTPLVFGPGGTGPPTNSYTILLSELASYGYVVVSLDHLYEQPYVTLPNGTVVVGLPLDVEVTLELAEALYDVRVRDLVYFVRQGWAPLVEDLGLPFGEAESFAAFGHSLGGAAAVGAALEDESIIGTLNLDGGYWRLTATDSPEIDTGRPLLQLGQEQHTDALDPTWGTLPAQQSGWWETILVQGANHQEFSDLGQFYKRFPNAYPSFGTIDGDRMAEVVGAYSRAFFDFVVLGEEQELFKGNSTAFPDVLIYDGSEF